MANRLAEISTLMKSKIEISCLQTIKITIKILTDVPRQSFLMEYVSGEGLLPKYTTYNNDCFQMFTKPENEKIDSMKEPSTRIKPVK